jgi:hypothetical protein
MSTVSLSTAVLTRASELFVFFSKKAAFNIDEYADAGAVYARVLEAAKTGQPAEVTVTDATYLVSAITVCSQRTPVEVANYKPIAELLESLQGSLKKESDEQAEEKTTITEM